jgi:hypothetical protein
MLTQLHNALQKKLFELIVQRESKTETTMAHLSNQLELTSRVRLEDEITQIFTDKALFDSQIGFILNSYSEKWREFHNCDYVLRLLELLSKTDTSNLSSAEYKAVQAMIVYHRVEYKLGHEKNWNAEESRETAGKALTFLGYDLSFLRTMESGIRALGFHSLDNVEESDQLAIGLFLDLTRVVEIRQLVRRIGIKQYALPD